MQVIFQKNAQAVYDAFWNDFRETSRGVVVELQAAFDSRGNVVRVIAWIL